MLVCSIHHLNLTWTDLSERCGRNWIFVWKWNLCIRGEFPSCCLIPGNWLQKIYRVCVYIWVPVKPLKIPEGCLWLQTFLKCMHAAHATLIMSDRRWEKSKLLVYLFYYEECLCITVDSGRTNMNKAMNTWCPLLFTIISFFLLSTDPKA